jgi:hypothetical protein
MNDEDLFIRAIARVESSDDPNVRLGDNGRAAGRYQQHPTFYASWQPTTAELQTMHEPTWDQCYELALRKFWRKRPVDKAFADVAVAYHLHGQHVYSGDDQTYRQRFESARKALLANAE